MGNPSNNFGTLAASAGINAGAGALGSLISAGINTAFFKKNLESQKQVSMELAEHEQKLQKEMAVDSAALQKEGLVKAGLNPALMSNGVGTLAGANVNAPSGGGSGTMQGSVFGNLDLADIKQKVASADLTAAQAEGQKINNRYLDQQNLVDIALKASQIDVNAATIDNFNHTIQLVDAQRDLTKEQKNEVLEKINKLKAETENIRINNEYQARINEAEIARAEADAKKAIAEADYTNLKVALGRLGIFVDASWASNLLSMSQSGASGEIVESLGSAIGGIAEKLPSAIGNAFTGIVKGALSAAKSKAVNLVKSLFD